MTTSQNIVLIPAYEPGPSLLELLRDLSAHGCGNTCETSIIVVDDGSGPDFAQIFEEARSLAIVLTHKENRGKGAALKTGLSYSQLLGD